jgi:hypothetical protein
MPQNYIFTIVGIINVFLIHIYLTDNGVLDKVHKRLQNLP